MTRKIIEKKLAAVKPEFVGHSVSADKWFALVRALGVALKQRDDYIRFYFESSWYKAPAIMPDEEIAKEIEIFDVEILAALEGEK